MTEEIEEQNKKELKDKNNNNKIDNQSMMSIENNLITRKKVKIKTLRRLNLDLPDELLQYDNENEIASNKPTSRNQIIESYGDLTHRSMFFPKPKKVGDLKKNSSTHFEQFNDIKNKLNIDNENNENDNFSNKDEEKKEENNEKEESEIEKNPEKENDKIDEEQN